jgi:outer membrane protein
MFMKKPVSLSALLALGTLLAAPALQAQTKVGVIDVQRVVADSAVGKESLAKIQRIAGTKQEDVTKRQKELRDLEQKIQDQSKTLSAEALEKTQKDYQNKAVELKRFQDDAQRELEELQRKELQEFEKQVMPVIDTVAKEKGFQLVFNKFQSGLLFADESNDLTDEVIKAFNSRIASPAAAKPAAAPAKPASPAAAPAAKPPAKK